MDAPLTSETHAADTRHLAFLGATDSSEAISVIAPPLYAAFVLARRGRSALTLNRFLRAIWVADLAGSVAGGGIAYARYSNASFETTRARRIEDEYDTNRIRRDDYTVIGTVVLGVLTPALLWNRANKLHLFFGGGTLGGGVGVLAHYGKSLMGDVPAKIALNNQNNPTAQDVPKQ